MDSVTADIIATTADGGQLVSDLAGALKDLVTLAREKKLDEALFLFKKPVDLGQITLPSKKIALLRKTRIIEVDPKRKRLWSNVMIHVNPHKGLCTNKQVDKLDSIIIVTDWPDVAPEPNPLFDGREMVFPLHYESFAVINQLPKHPHLRKPSTKVLDIFCGSGVLGIYASKLGARSVAFSDMLSRSLAFARLNGSLNEIPNAEFVLSDMFDSVSSTTQFDMILANPPFEPISEEEQEKYFYHSCGGSSGQELMNRFLREVFRHLQPDGLALAVNFFLSDMTGGKTEQQIDALKSNPDLSKASVTATVFDQVPVKDFWLRYGALGIDPYSEHRDELLRKNLPFLLLCTLTITALETNSFSTQPLVDFEEEPPPVPWWNPLNWPLPCGISTKAVCRDNWVSRWLAHESEKRNEGGVIQAESMASREKKEIVFWDYKPAFDYLPTEDDEAHRLIRENFLSMVLDARYLNLANVITPVEVSFTLFPETMSEAAVCHKISSPSLPQRARKSRGDFLKENWKDYIHKLTFAEIRDELRQFVSESESESEVILFICRIMDPWKSREVNEGLLELDDYRKVMKGSLVWRGKQFDPPRFETSSISLDEILYLKTHEVQRFLLRFEISSGGVTVLKSLSDVLDLDWKHLIYEQCYRFLRDRFTLLAFPMAWAQQREDELRNNELLQIQRRVLAFIAHSLKNTIGKEIPNNAPPAHVNRHYKLDLFTLEAAEAVGTPPLKSKIQWSTGGYEEESIGRTIEAVFNRIEHEGCFQLYIEDGHIKNASVDPRFVAIIIELSRNLFKQRNSAKQGQIVIRKIAETQVDLTVHTKALSDHAYALCEKLKGSEMISSTHSGKIGGVTFIASLANEISSGTGCATEWTFAYEDSNIEDETVTFSNTRQGWRVKGPKSVLDRGTRPKADHLKMDIRIINCLIDDKEEVR